MKTSESKDKIWMEHVISMTDKPSVTDLVGNPRGKDHLEDLGVD